MADEESRVSELDEMLRRRGREKLKAEVKAAAHSLRMMLEGSHAITCTDLRDAAGNKLFAHVALAMVLSDLVNARAEQYERSEIIDFVARVNELHEQVDELRSRIDGSE